MDPCKEVSIHCQDVENLKWNPRGFGHWSFVNNRPFYCRKFVNWAIWPGQSLARDCKILVYESEGVSGHSGHLLHLPWNVEKCIGFILSEWGLRKRSRVENSGHFWCIGAIIHPLISSNWSQLKQVEPGPRNGKWSEGQYLLEAECSLSIFIAAVCNCTQINRIVCPIKKFTKWAMCQN